MKSITQVLSIALLIAPTFANASGPTDESDAIEVEVTEVTKREWVGRRVRNNSNGDEMGLVCHSKDSDGDCAVYQLVFAPMGYLKEAQPLTPPVGFEKLIASRDNPESMGGEKPSMPRVGPLTYGVLYDGDGIISDAYDEIATGILFHAIGVAEVMYVLDGARLVTYYPFAAMVKGIARGAHKARVNKLSKDLSKALVLGQPDLEPVGIKSKRFERLRAGLERAYGKQPLN